MVPQAHSAHQAGLRRARHDVEGEVLTDPVEVAERDRKLAIVHALALVFGAS